MKLDETSILVESLSDFKQLTQKLINEDYTISSKESWSEYGRNTLVIINHITKQVKIKKFDYFDLVGTLVNAALLFLAIYASIKIALAGTGIFQAVTMALIAAYLAYNLVEKTHKAYRYKKEFKDNYKMYLEGENE